MKKLASSLLFTALLSSGCLREFDFRLPDAKSPPAAREDANALAPPAPPVTADQVNDKNVGEMCERLAIELKREESSERTKTNEIVDKPKLAIP
jgi:hypothetical protein